jgi:hypothetical protein
MESSVAPRSPSRLPALAAAAFAAYGCWSLLMASSSYFLGGTMFGQAVLYFAVAAALARRADWAGWFAVGIATSGLVVDAAFLGFWSFNFEMVLDTAAQAGLLWLAMNCRAHVGTTDSGHRLTGTAASPIGWTFALAAGVLPPAVMGAFMPTAVGCEMLAPPPWHDPGSLTVMALLAVGGLFLVARLRTLGLLVLGASFTMASFTLTRIAREGWEIYAFLPKTEVEAIMAWSNDAYLPVHPGHFMTMVASGFAFAALLPLGPSFLRALFRGKTVAHFRDE